MSSAPTVVASSVPLPPETYAHLVRIVPCLSAAAPASIEAWITTTGPGGVVSLHLYQRGALPPPPSYVPSSPMTDNKYQGNGGEKQFMAAGSLPDAFALVATMVFLGPSQISLPTLGPAAPALPPGTPMPPPEPVNVWTFSVQKVYEWMGYQASLTGRQLPWAPAVLVGAGGAAAAVGAPPTAEEERLKKENEKLQDKNDWLCCLAIFCCCCNCCCD